MNVDELPKVVPLSNDHYRATARWLALGIAGLIVWGSLYPLEFQAPTGAQLAARLAHAGSHFLSRTDLIANLLLYLPFGAACALAVGAGRPVRRVALAGLLGSMLSLSVELTQLATPHRVTSVFDWALNSGGALIGAAGIALYMLIGVRWRPASLLQPRPAVIPLCLLALWFIGEFAPYPSMHGAAPLHKLWRLRHILPADNWLVPLATWWIVGECLRHILRRPWNWLCYAALIGASVSARLFTLTHPLGGGDIAGCLAATAALGATGQWHSRPRAVVTAVCCLAAATAAVLPVRFAQPIGEFHWIPFSGSLLASRDYRPLLATWLLSGATLWSTTLVLQRLSLAFMLTLGLSVAGEVARLWTPQRRSEITDPLIVIVIYAAMLIARRFQAYAFGWWTGAAPPLGPPKA